MLPATQEKRRVPVLRAEKVLLRPKGPAIQIARAIGRGIDNNDTFTTLIPKRSCRPPENSVLTPLT